MSPPDSRALAAGLQRIQDTLQGHKATMDSLLAGYAKHKAVGRVIGLKSEAGTKKKV
jgi:hypothetical protein